MMRTENFIQLQLNFMSLPAPENLAGEDLQKIYQIAQEAIETSNCLIGIKAAQEKTISQLKAKNVQAEKLLVAYKRIGKLVTGQDNLRGEVLKVNEEDLSKVLVKWKCGHSTWEDANKLGL